MKTLRTLFCALTVALAIAAISTAAWAAPQECGLIGTWSGYSGKSTAPYTTWLSTHTAGTHDTNGQLPFDWVFVSEDTLAGATRLTSGHGVWQQTAKGHYKYTWYAFGLDESGAAIYSVRVSGLATNTDCDNISIDFAYEICWPPVLPQDLTAIS